MFRGFLFAESKTLECRPWWAVHDDASVEAVIAAQLNIRPSRPVSRKQPFDLAQCKFRQRVLEGLVFNLLSGGLHAHPRS
jgi:hypothetical protein